MWMIALPPGPVDSVNLFEVLFYAEKNGIFLADHKGGQVSPLGADHKQMWKLWPVKNTLKRT